MDKWINGIKRSTANVLKIENHSRIGCRYQIGGDTALRRGTGAVKAVIGIFDLPQDGLL